MVWMMWTVNRCGNQIEENPKNFDPHQRSSKEKPSYYSLSYSYIQRKRCDSWFFLYQFRSPLISNFGSTFPDSNSYSWWALYILFPNQSHLYQYFYSPSSTRDRLLLVPPEIQLPHREDQSFPLFSSTHADHLSSR